MFIPGLSKEILEKIEIIPEIFENCGYFLNIIIKWKNSLQNLKIDFHKELFSNCPKKFMDDVYQIRTDLIPLNFYLNLNKNNPFTFEIEDGILKIEFQRSKMEKIDIINDNFILNGKFNEVN